MTRRMVRRQAGVVRQNQAQAALLEQVGLLVPLLQHLELRQAPVLPADSLRSRPYVQ